MIVDISKIKPGDMLTFVPFEVDSMADWSITVKDPRGFKRNFSTDQITTHTPKPTPREIEVGDRVRGGMGKVIGIEDGWVYVVWEEGDGVAYPYDPSDRDIAED